MLIAYLKHRAVEGLTPLIACLMSAFTLKPTQLIHSTYTATASRRLLPITLEPVTLPPYINAINSFTLREVDPAYSSKHDKSASTSDLGLAHRSEPFLAQRVTLHIL